MPSPSSSTQPQQMPTCAQLSPIRKRQRNSARQKNQTQTTKITKLRPETGKKRITSPEWSNKQRRYTSLRKPYCNNWNSTHPIEQNSVDVRTTDKLNNRIQHRSSDCTHCWRRPCRDTSVTASSPLGCIPARVVVSVEIQGELAAVDDGQRGERVRVPSQTAFTVHSLCHGLTASGQTHRVDRLVACRGRHLQPADPLPKLHGVDPASLSRLAQIPVAEPGALALRYCSQCQRGRIPAMLDVRHQTRVTSVDVTPTPHDGWSLHLGRTNPLH